MRAAVVGMVLLCEIAQGAEPKSVTNSIGMELIKISAGKFVMGKERRAVGAGLLEVTFSPFIDPAGMLGFLLLTSPERVGFLDGKEAFQ